MSILRPIDPAASTDQQSLEALRLRIYAIVFPIGIFTIAFVWLLGVGRGTMAPFERYALPLLALIFTAFATTLFYRRSLLRQIEAITFVVVSAYFIIQLYLVVYDNFLTGVDRSFATLPQWIPLIYILAFLIFKTRGAMISSLAFLGALILPGALILLIYGLPSLQTQTFSDLLQIYLSNAIYVPLLSGLAVLKERFTDIALRAEAMARMASVDYLTGLFNRRHLDMSIRTEIEHAERYDRPISVILFDIDRFKQLNDRHGHDMGDFILENLAIRVLQTLRGSDVFGRWGGEEFLIVAPETDYEHAFQLAQRLRELIAADPLGPAPLVTASFGVASYIPGDSLETLVKRADEALYEAKHSGRNRVVGTHPTAQPSQPA
jgi:diguanylate cyclase (GGDEF)-like protein